MTVPVKIPVINCGIGVFYDTGLNLPVDDRPFIVLAETKPSEIPVIYRERNFFTDIQLPVKIPVINGGPFAGGRSSVF